ncbi:MAG: hypothetical protein FWG59_04980 [Betaproteobacteria bacterium]|nr:hypothetical protein [Betaproteobacteria bacterium]
MAVAVVNRLCAPTASALKQAGLEYLLFDAAQAQTIRSGLQATAQQPESADMRELAVQHSPAARTLQNAVQGVREKNDSQALPRKAPPPRAAEPPNAASNPAAWPATWRECLKRTRSAPVIWTYWELGRDLCGAPDPKRRDLLRELLQDLAHPPGTHSFWPLALPRQKGGGEREQELEANAPIFWEGVRLLHGRAVMIMGAQAMLGSLALPDRMLEMHPFQQVRHRGRLLIVLPPPDTFIQENQRIQSLREFLRQTLTPFV